MSICSLPAVDRRTNIAKLNTEADSHPQITARIRFGAGAVARAIAVARRFAQATGLPPETSDRLVIVVEEWAANVVEHSQAAPHSLIGLRLDRASDGVGVRFSDAGVAFDPRTVEEKGPNLERGGGAGIALIRFWSEIDSYKRRRGRNRLAIRLKS